MPRRNYWTSIERSGERDAGTGGQAVERIAERNERIITAGIVVDGCPPSAELNQQAVRQAVEVDERAI
jgi:coenzyme F420-reducing hydrogenase gamma subunit